MNFPRKLWKSCLEKTSIVSYNYLGELLKLGGFFFFFKQMLLLLCVFPCKYCVACCLCISWGMKKGLCRGLLSLAQCKIFGGKLYAGIVDIRASL